MDNAKNKGTRIKKFRVWGGVLRDHEVSETEREGFTYSAIQRVWLRLIPVTQKVDPELVTLTLKF